MKFFTKNEILGLAAILAVIFIVTFLNMQVAMRKARDIQRREDIGKLVDALNTYRDEYGFLPPAEEGKIKSCKADNYEEVLKEVNSLEKFDKELFYSGLKICEWGRDPLPDLFGEGNSNYLSTLPRDPGDKTGISYLYISNGNRFQIYAYQEGAEEEPGFNQGIITRNLSCGNAICNFGRASPGVPVEKSIEEYELELLNPSDQ